MEAGGGTASGKGDSMSRSSVHRRMAVLLVAGALALPLSAAASHSRSLRPAAQAVHAPTGLIANLWGRFVHLWGAEGCTGDPYGRCVPSPSGSGVTAQAQPPVDAGCGGDPYGRCNAAQ
jgi:hypothetical protein